MKQNGGPEHLDSGSKAVCIDGGGAPASVRQSHGRSATNFWVDLMAFVTFLASAISGLVLLRGPDAARFGAQALEVELLLGMTRFEWEHLHNHISIVFVILVLAHLAMHRRWIAGARARSSIPKNKE